MFISLYKSFKSLKDRNIVVETSYINDNRMIDVR